MMNEKGDTSVAEFKTHLTVSSFCSSAAATFLLAASLATPDEVLLFFVMGVVGGLLPDIDSDSSLPVRLLFTFIATVISFLIMFNQGADNSAAELFTIWLVSFFVVNFLFFSMFTRITVHRGIIHSVPASFVLVFIHTHPLPLLQLSQANRLDGRVFRLCRLSHPPPFRRIGESRSLRQRPEALLGHRL